MSGDLVSQRVADLMAAPREHGGRRVVTLRDVAEAHKKPIASVRRAFHKHKTKFVEGADYVLIDAPGSVPNRHTPQAVEDLRQQRAPRRAGCRPRKAS